MIAIQVIIVIIMTVCSCHVTYVFQSESTLYGYLNVKELLARGRRGIWSLSDCSWTRTHNQLVYKQTLNEHHLAKLAEWLSVLLWNRLLGSSPVAEIIIMMVTVIIIKCRSRSRTLTTTNTKLPGTYDCQKPLISPKASPQCCVGPICASQTAYSSLNLINRGRTCRWNSLLETLPHLISQEFL